MRALKISNSITPRDELSLEKYLNDISKYDVLTPEEELALFKRLRSGDDQAINIIVRHNLRFVVSVSKQYQHTGMSLTDLINEGNIGLIKAAQRFDETKGFKFISYAVWWIRQSILQAVNEKTDKIRIPLNLRANILDVVSKREEFIQKNEREPSVEELAKATEFKVEMVKKCLEYNLRCSSLDAPLAEDSETALSGVLRDKNIPAPDYNMAVNESQKTEVEQLLKTLKPRQAEIISMYFGINGQKAMSLEDISDQIGVSRERVRQIKERSLRRLRRNAQTLTSK
jgi:RNA polymerase primary sigma factor